MRFWSACIAVFARSLGGCVADLPLEEDSTVADVTASNLTVVASSIAPRVLPNARTTFSVTLRNTTSSTWP